MTDLIELRAENSNFIGPISDNVGDLVNLQTLYLSSDVVNGASTGLLTGTLPTSVGNLVALQDLRLYGNALSGNLPTELGNCASLYYLDIEYNNFSGQIPASLGNLSLLERFYLSHNNFSGSMPQEVCAIRNDYLLSLVVDCTLSCPLTTCCTQCL